VTGKIFQALPNFCPHRPDTTFAFIYKIDARSEEAVAVVASNLVGPRESLVL